MLAYWISVIIFTVFCAILLGIFYIMIKIQEKRFEKYLNEKTLEAINIINSTNRDMIAIAIDTIDSEWRGKDGQS